MAKNCWPLSGPVKRKSTRKTEEQWGRVGKKISEHVCADCRREKESIKKVYLNSESWRSCRRSLYKIGPVNCGSTPLCNIGKQPRGLQKQRNDCFEKMPQRGSWLNQDCTCLVGFHSLHINLNMPAKVIGVFFIGLQAQLGWDLIEFIESESTFKYMY